MANAAATPSLLGGKPCLLTMCAVVLAGSAAVSVPCAAAPITYHYTGAVTTGVGALPAVPVGTPVTFTVTADPNNPVATVPLAPYVAGYLATIDVQLPAFNYQVMGALEVNGDAQFPGAVQASGFVNLRTFSTSGPVISGFGPRFCGVPTPIGCYAFDVAATDPTSAALLLPYPTFSFPILLQGAGGAAASIYITGSPQAVPEPSSVLLMSAGLFGVRYLRQRKYRSRS